MMADSDPPVDEPWNPDTPLSQTLSTFLDEQMPIDILTAADLVLSDQFNESWDWPDALIEGDSNPPQSTLTSTQHTPAHITRYCILLLTLMYTYLTLHIVDTDRSTFGRTLGSSYNAAPIGNLTDIGHTTIGGEPLYFATYIIFLRVNSTTL